MPIGSLTKSQRQPANVEPGRRVRLSSVSLIIPAYNDEETIGRLLRDADRLLPEVCQSYEIIVCNDGSRDGTLDVIKAEAALNENIQVINHPTNKGYGATIRELYLAGRNDYIFSLPGDYQYAPKELLTMARGLDENDFVIGWRVNRNDPLRRKLQSIVYNMMLRIVYGNKHKDVNSIKLFRRQILETIELRSQSPFVDAELCIRSSKAGFKVIEIPIEHLPRLTQGASGGKLSVITETFSDLVKMRSTF
ncbi:MAG: glycosyltransferase family 2 protein [Candidatus Obscuribacterales bacterium]|nr:glycosyltransferase family 2 protein [Candidatus Obscuribacterales bacterium]